MRTGIFLSALLATVMFGGVALADKSGESETKNHRSENIKQQVLDKMKEGFGKQSRSTTATRRDLKQDAVSGRSRPRGEVYGDQATRSGKTRASSASGRNMSASGRVNTPTEIRAMLQLINPMNGAYRTSQAAEGTDSYAGNKTSRVSLGQQKNHSATGRINTPAELKAFKAMIMPMAGAYRTSQAAEGTDSYGGESKVTMPGHDHTTQNVHFKNDRGEVINTTKGNTATAMKNREMRDQMIGMIKAKMAQKANIAGK